MSDARTRRSQSGNVDVPGLLHAWSRDVAWRECLLSMSDDERGARLAALGGEVYDQDVGFYASEVRHHSRGLDEYWDDAERSAFLRRHAVLLFLSALDDAVWRSEAAAKLTRPVQLHGLDWLRGARAGGRGVMLLSVNQGHPGPLLFHPALRDIEVGVIQHCERPESGGPLSLGERRWLLSADRAGLRHARALLARGGVVLLAGDYIFPGVLGIQASLFGRPVLIARAALALAGAAQVPVLPVALSRHWPPAECVHEVHFFPPVPLPDFGAADFLVGSALAFGAVMEALIRRAPEQWRLWNTLDERWRAAETG